MTAYPRITIDLAGIRENARLLAGLCGKSGIQAVGVTKATCGDPRVARAMLDAGIRILGESRLENARRLREGGIDAPLVLLRAPMISQAAEVVAFFECSLNSEPATILALDKAAAKAGKRHKVVLMIDLGDRREGILPADLDQTVLAIAKAEHIHFAGLGTNLACCCGVIPTPENMNLLLELHRRGEEICGHALPVISGGNSSCLELLMEGNLPPVTELRLGESILLGRETVARAPIPGARLDCFSLEAEVIELRRKPSMPEGEIGQDTLGRTRAFQDHGERLRAICAIGRQDVAMESLQPLPGIRIIDAGSDHLVLDVTDYPEPLSVGDVLPFRLGYSALLSTMSSPYVSKRYLL